MIKDSEYIIEIMNDFFRSKDIKKRFLLLEEYKEKLSGWEIWLQIEFAYFLASHETNPEWYREEGYDYDKRKEKLKIKFKPDFLIRKSGWAKFQYMAVEFKQNQQALTCFKNMLSDLEKFTKIRDSNNDLRSIWCVGIFHSVDIQNAYDSISKYLEKIDSEFTLNDILFDKIDKSDYWYMIL